MKKIHVVIATLVAVAIVLFAPAAKGQAPATAVVPSKVPSSLNIGSTNSVLEWVVTNKQWNLYGDPLGTHTGVRVNYWKKDGAKAAKVLSIADLEYDSFADFEQKIADAGSQALGSLSKSTVIDTSRPLDVSVTYGYDDYPNNEVNGTPGEMGLYMKKDLGLLSELSRDSFIGGYTFTVIQVVIRVDDLQEFEVLSKNPSRRLLWKSPDAVKSSAGQLERVRPGVIVLNGLHYANPDSEVSFRVKAGGQEKLYNEFPAIKLIDSSVLEVDLIGFQTGIESSTDLVHWAPFKVFQAGEVGIKRIPTYPPPSSNKQMFFRVWVNKTTSP